MLDTYSGNVYNRSAMQLMLPLTVKIIEENRSKDAPFVAYTPELDVASCGPSEGKARQNLHEAVEILLEEVSKKGELPTFLEELGFQKVNKTWVPPVISFESFSFPYSI